MGGEAPWPAPTLTSWINHFLWRPGVSCGATAPRLKIFSLLNLHYVDLKATAESRELSLYIHLTKIDSLRIFIKHSTVNFLWEPIWSALHVHVLVMQLSFKTLCMWLLSMVACWDLIVKIVTHWGDSLIFSSVHRQFTLYCMCHDYNYSLYFYLIHWHGTAGGWWVLTVGCWSNYAVWGTSLPACTYEIVTVLRPTTVEKVNISHCHECQ